MKAVIHTGSSLVLTGDARGVSIQCLDGSLWVTQPGDPADHILSAGERLTIDRRGRIVISSLLEAEAAVVGGRSGVLGLPRWKARLAVFGRPQAPAELSRRQRAA